MADQTPGVRPPIVRIDQIMTVAVYRVTTDMKLRDVIRMLVAQKISGAPVVDGFDKVLSVISEGDAMRLAAAFGLEATIATCMPELVRSPKLITLKKDATFSDAYRLFMKHGIHRVIVVDDTFRLQGLVSRSNILRLLVEGLKPQYKRKPPRAA